jgi:hypothetical protein
LLRPLGPFRLISTFESCVMVDDAMVCVMEDAREKRREGVWERRKEG